MNDEKKTGRTRLVKKYVFFGPAILQEEYEKSSWFDTGCGQRGQETVYFWKNADSRKQIEQKLKTL